MEPTSSVRRPESGTWQRLCGDGDSSNGKAVQGPMTHWTWQQHEEAPVICQHPMTKMEPNQQCEET
ncbi:unnamed protein product [Staurois parvus]|uniref:Uncharacterized protein n=1 Tax=Staurois parvus TaxID=386267 RepID=A0ABN9B456_9NEOB|nr:unnamed protein product [Staurois parvus]